MSNPYTLNFPYGVGLVADGTGVLLNNELDDFTAAPGASNAFGLVGSRPICRVRANGRCPRCRRPSCSRTAGRSGDGLAGGSRIISAVLQIVVGVLDYRMDVAAAVAAPRVHHQWMPDVVRVERGFSEEMLAALKAKGHEVIEPLGQTSANSIAITPNGLLGAPDPRTRGRRRRGNDPPVREIGGSVAAHPSRRSRCSLLRMRLLLLQQAKPHPEEATKWPVRRMGRNNDL